VPTTTDAATSLLFSVSVDGEELGAFTGCDGLSAEYELEEYPEGGENRYVHRIPGRLKFGTVKLTRNVDADSARLAAWFSSYREKVSRKTAVITAYDAMQSGGRPKVISTWNLAEVFPLRWTGPTFGIDQSGVAKETLELVHNGFLDRAG
jgi:phage tail-like protein